MSNENKNHTVKIVKTTNSNYTITYQIKSTTLVDTQFDDQLEKLMSQELVYGETNYY
jgi:hypothetical protein